MEIVTYRNLKLVPDFLGRPEKALPILFLGDIQIGSDTDLRRLKLNVDFVTRIGAYVIGMGDYIDVHSPSNRQLIAAMKAAAYDSTAESLDRAGMDYVQDAYEILKPLKGRILGMIRGHHWCQFSGNNGDSTTVLAKLLDSRNLGDSAILNLEFAQGRQKLVCRVFAHHGTGSGQLASAALSTAEGRFTKMFQADIYAMGHQTKQGAVPIPLIGTREGEDGKYHMFGTKRFIVATGGYSKGYVEGSTDDWGNPAGGYVEQKALVPTALGSPLAIVRPIFKGRRVDINVVVS